MGLRDNGRVAYHPSDYGAAYYPYDTHDYIFADMHGEPIMQRKVDYPNPAYLLRFHKVASSLFVMHRQANYRDYPREVWW